MEIEFDDIITISFIQRCDGKVLQTNIEQVARDNDIYDKNGDYSPITISSGHDTFPDALYEELIGKEIGAKGTVIIPPEKEWTSCEINSTRFLLHRPLRFSSVKNSVLHGLGQALFHHDC